MGDQCHSGSQRSELVFITHLPSCSPSSNTEGTEMWNIKKGQQTCHFLLHKKVHNGIKLLSTCVVELLSDGSIWLQKKLSGLAM